MMSATITTHDANRESFQVKCTTQDYNRDMAYYCIAIAIYVHELVIAHNYLSMYTQQIDMSCASLQ